MSYGPDRGPYPSYYRAVNAAAQRLSLEVETSDLATTPQNAASVDGIVFTGGPDLDPARYGMGEYAPFCTVDADRDEREFALYDAAAARGVPIFAICRGAQLLNVARGGTLIPDLPDIKAVHHGQVGGNDRRHPLVLVSGSTLAAVCGTERGEVNTSHHQAVDKVAPDFAVSARADDGVIEAFEWAAPAGKPFLLAVQWHPERMGEDEPLAKPLFDRFLVAAREFSELIAAER